MPFIKNPFLDLKNDNGNRPTVSITLKNIDTKQLTFSLMFCVLYLSNHLHCFKREIKKYILIFFNCPKKFITNSDII